MTLAALSRDAAERVLAKLRETELRLRDARAALASAGFIDEADCLGVYADATQEISSRIERGLASAAG